MPPAGLDVSSMLWPESIFAKVGVGGFAFNAVSTVTTLAIEFTVTVFVAESVTPTQ